VAYYHRFEALEAQCKSEINADDLRDACRLVNRERLHDPLQTLQNPRNLGEIDHRALAERECRAQLGQPPVEDRLDLPRRNGREDEGAGEGPENHHVFCTTVE
jgi:hypothetical protein